VLALLVEAIEQEDNSLVSLDPETHVGVPCFQIFQLSNEHNLSLQVADEGLPVIWILRLERGRILESKAKLRLSFLHFRVQTRVLVDQQLLCDLRQSHFDFWIFLNVFRFFLLHDLVLFGLDKRGNVTSSRRADVDVVLLLNLWALLGRASLPVQSYQVCQNIFWRLGVLMLLGAAFVFSRAFITRCVFLLRLFLWRKIDLDLELFLNFSNFFFNLEVLLSHSSQHFLAHLSSWHESVQEALHLLVARI